MDQTYRNAIVVSVWLGLPPIPEFLTEQLVNYHQPIKTFKDGGFDWSDSIEDLANRPYWTRFWVIQEYLLCQEVHLYCGNSRVDWLHFRTLLGWETGIDDCMQEDVDYARSPSGSWAAWPLTTGRHPDKHPELQQSLYKLLITHGGSKCKDPRDRVFALLGLVTPGEKVLLERFLPDYNMTEDDVVLIALCHVRFNADNAERRNIDVKWLLLALGVESESRQRRLVRRSCEYDYPSDHPPRAYRDWICDEENDGFDISHWGWISGPDSNVFDNSNWGEMRETRDGDRKSRRARYITCILMLFSIVVLVKRYWPQAWDAFVSFVLRSVAKV